MSAWVVSDAVLDRLDEADRTLVMVGAELLLLGPLGALLLDRCAAPARAVDLAAACVEAFGAPTQESAEACVLAALADLTSAGILREVVA